jgi:hypothetical protein
MRSQKRGSSFLAGGQGSEGITVRSLDSAESGGRPVSECRPRPMPSKALEAKEKRRKGEK